MNKAMIGLAAALLASTSLCSAAQAQHKHTVRICTGSPAGNYTKVGAKLQAQMESLKKDLKVEIIHTDGSVDNLNRMASGECDIALAQNDAIRNYFESKPEAKNKIGRSTALYAETVHGFCNKAYAEKHGIKRIPDVRDVKGFKMAVGVAGSGHNETWRSIKAADPKYAKVGEEFVGGLDAMETIADGIDSQCMVYTAGLRSGDAMKWNNAYGDKVTMIGFNDGDLDAAKDEQGRPIYRLSVVPAGTYRKFQPSGVACMGSCEVKAAQVDAILIYNQDWRKGNRPAYEIFVDAKNNIQDQVKKEMNPN